MCASTEGTDAQPYKEIRCLEPWMTLFCCQFPTRFVDFFFFFPLMDTWPSGLWIGPEWPDGLSLTHIHKLYRCQRWIQSSERTWLSLFTIVYCRWIRHLQWLVAFTDSFWCYYFIKNRTNSKVFAEHFTELFSKYFILPLGSLSIHSGPLNIYYYNLFKPFMLHFRQEVHEGL